MVRVDAPKCDEREPVILEPEQFEKLLAESHEPMLRLWTLLLNESGVR